MQTWVCTKVAIITKNSILGTKIEKVELWEMLIPIYVIVKQKLTYYNDKNNLREKNCLVWLATLSEFHVTVFLFASVQNNPSHFFLKLILLKLEELYAKIV